MSDTGNPSVNDRDHDLLEAAFPTSPGKADPSLLGPSLPVSSCTVLAGLRLLEAIPWVSASAPTSFCELMESRDPF